MHYGFIFFRATQFVMTTFLTASKMIIFTELQFDVLINLPIIRYERYNLRWKYFMGLKQYYKIESSDARIKFFTYQGNQQGRIVETFDITEASRSA